MKVVLAAGFALAVLALAPESFRFTVEKDDAISSVWSLTTTREVHHAELSLMDDTQDVGSDSTTTVETSIELVDSFMEVAEDGTPLAIKRSYEALGTDQSRSGMEDKDVVTLENDGESDLAGADVEFTFDPDTEEWSATFADGSSGEEDWLEELTPRVDLAGVLPDEEIGAGSTWDLPTSFLADVLRPGGKVMVMDPPDIGDAPEGGIQIRLPNSDATLRLEDFEGDVTATFEEIVSKGDHRLAKIVIEVDIEADLDVIEELEAEADERGSAETYVDATLHRELQGTLTVLWDLTTHRAHAVEGELEGSSEMQVEWTMSSGDFDLELAYEEESDLTLSVEATFGD